MKYINNYQKNEIQDLVKKFQTQGFVKVSSLFCPSFIEYLHEHVDKVINQPVDKYQKGFNRISFDLFTKNETVMGLLSDNDFRLILTSITGRDLFFTQGLGFELEKNKSTGFPWHIGTQSFAYQHSDDFGCTIWIPLAKIDTANQRGGMAYVPENIISGKFMYDFIDPASARCIQLRDEKGEPNELEEYLQFRDEPLNNRSMTTLLDYFAHEDDFDIGDVLIFNKNVIHKSVKLTEGEIERRGAFVMRFIDPNSKYDQKRALDVESPRKIFNYSGCSTFHLDVCKENGEIIAESDFFYNKDARLVKKDDE